MTFFEIKNLLDGQRILTFVADGVTSAEEAELHRMAEELAG